MKCPFCKKDNDKVIDSRSSSGGFSIRRRRQCLECGRRYTTYEKIEETPLRVVKKDGSRVQYDREKILAGLRKACEKRPVSADALDSLVDEMEADKSSFLWGDTMAIAIARDLKKLKTLCKKADKAYKGRSCKKSTDTEVTEKF